MIFKPATKNFRPKQYYAKIQSSLTQKRLESFKSTSSVAWRLFVWNTDKPVNY